MRIFYLSCLSTWQEPLCTPFLDWTHCLVLGSISEREVNQKNLEKIFFCIWYASAIPHSGKRFAFLWWWPFEWEMSLLSSHPPVGLSWVVKEKEVYIWIFLGKSRRIPNLMIHEKIQRDLLPWLKVFFFIQYWAIRFTYPLNFSSKE